MAIMRACQQEVLDVKANDSYPEKEIHDEKALVVKKTEDFCT